MAAAELKRGGEDDEEGAGMAIVSDISPLGFAANTDPQEPQKRLLSNISAEQDGHLVIQRDSLKRYTSFPFANSGPQVRSTDSTA